MTEVFIKKADKKPSPYAGYTLQQVVGVSTKTGEIGIEIEVEGNKFPKGDGYQHNENDYMLIPKQWKFVNDGSLRGDDNAEYVLSKPIKFSEVEEAVTALWKMFEDYGSVLDESNRTSVHVHLNVQRFHMNRLCAFVSMYFVVEELLTAWCGDHRVGNLFCLRGRDAPAIIRRLKEFIRADGYGFEFSQGMHYAGLNPSAIHKFGSIEIRSLRGVNDPQVILDWVAILERLYTLSGDFKDPREVVSGFSGNGPIAWLQNILGDKFSTVMNNVPYTTDEVRDILYNGIRLAQDLCYCRDWSEFKELSVESDPFGRKMKFSPVPPPSPNPGTSASLGSFYTSTVMNSAPASPHNSIHGVGAVIEKREELYENGTISLATYEQLDGLSIGSLESWFIGAGYLPATPEPVEEDYPEEYEEYFDEDE